MDARAQFLLHMYDQLFNNINRHIMVVWQSLSLVIGAFAGFVLVETGFIPLDFAAIVIVLLAAWFLAHVQDGSYWYNRNITIIGNIERQFLRPTDIRDIHFYFEKHKDNRMIDHFQIQYAFGLAIALLVLLYHFINRVWVACQYEDLNLEWTMTLPYALAIIASLFVYRRQRKNYKKFQRLLNTSPGMDVHGTDITN
jgi:hypothetical protein